MRDERLSSGATSDHAGHGGFDFEETEVVEETTDVIDDLAARDEDTARLVREDEVEVALPITRFLVLEPEVAGGQLMEVGCEEDHLGWGDGELALLGAGGCTYYADDVTTAEELVGCDEGVLILRVSK